MDVCNVDLTVSHIIKWVSTGFLV